MFGFLKKENIKPDFGILSLFPVEIFFSDKIIMPNLGKQIVGDERCFCVKDENNKFYINHEYGRNGYTFSVDRNGVSSANTRDIGIQKGIFPEKWEENKKKIQIGYAGNNINNKLVRLEMLDKKYVRFFRQSDNKEIAIMKFIYDYTYCNSGPIYSYNILFCPFGIESPEIILKTKNGNKNLLSISLLKENQNILFFPFNKNINGAVYNTSVYINKDDILILDLETLTGRYISYERSDISD
ncbi:MAG: hypothetical protein PHE25_05450 [Candidatus Gracilibacteria bacterium]|nr:hypothetical protein [Candidatus Gracilibacteria bacterium]